MFNSITQPRFPKAALGIDAAAISALTLQKAGRRVFTVKQAASVDLTPGVLVPSFTEDNIIDAVEFSACVKEAVEVAGLLGQKKWSIALPSTTARTAILSLDVEPTSRQELEEILDWKAEQSFGVPAVDLRIAKRKISPGRSGKARYFATAVMLTVIDEFESILEGFGWKTGLVLPRAIGEANWLLNTATPGYSLLISSNNDGFTALLLRGSEPAVVRSVTCSENEVDDEIFRLVMFYRDRYGEEGNGGSLERMLVIGQKRMSERAQEIAADALGQKVKLLSPTDVGLQIPVVDLSFDTMAAPAGLAALGFD